MLCGFGATVEVVVFFGGIFGSSTLKILDVSAAAFTLERLPGDSSLLSLCTVAGKSVLP